MSRHLVVVGGGITGLAAAWQASSDAQVQVTVLERDTRLGGKVHTSDIVLPDGTSLRIDEGADAFLARVPDAVALCGELGLADELTQPAVGRAKVFVEGRLHFLPDETVLGVPTDLDALAASGVLSEQGLARAAQEWHEHAPALDGDVAIGPFLAQRYGPELVERVVGPLVGGINAGDVDELSLVAVTPQLAEAAADGDSLSRALGARRSRAPQDGPVFHALRDGSGRLVDALAEALADRGVQLRTGAAAKELRRIDGGWQVVLDDEVIPADAVLLTSPVPTTAALVAPHCSRAASELASMTHSAVALVTFVFDADAVPIELDASGMLVPRSAGLLMTAVSWGSSKWAHWDDGHHVVLRASAGRTGDERQTTMSDDELVAALRADLGTTMGITAAPLATRVARWPLGFTQYTVGHLDRVDRIEAALADDCPGLAVAGAAYRGLGLPACIRQGRDAARRLLD